jgi:hypothetical protein
MSLPTQPGLSGKGWRGLIGNEVGYSFTCTVVRRTKMVFENQFENIRPYSRLVWGKQTARTTTNG